MKTTIVCGILGSGKTTFIQNVLKHSGEKTVVLVNDFGKTGIDGEILFADGINAVELPSGCVCCTLKFDLMRTLERIMNEFSPDHLYIEPSGVASPSGVLDALDTLKISPVLVVGIIDATEFVTMYESGMYGNFFHDQIIQSDILLINKTDLAEKEEVNGAVTIVGRMNERAVVIPTVNAEMGEALPGAGATERISNKDDHDIPFTSCSFSLKSKPPLSDLEGLFNEMLKGAFGKIVRAKALIRTDNGPFRFDLSFGQLKKIAFNAPISDNRLVVIGNALLERKLSEAIEKMS